jgi:hypothetical protein
MILPQKRTGNTREAIEWNRMVDALTMLLPRLSHKTKTSLTTRGTFQAPEIQRTRGGGASADNLVWL